MGPFGAHGSYDRTARLTNQEKNDQLNQLTQENQKFTSSVKNLEHQVTLSDQEKTRLLEQLQQTKEQLKQSSMQDPLLSQKCQFLEEKLVELQSLSKDLEQQLKIKDKMLDDQNDSLAKLKKNLEN